ncbi:YSC84-related protein [Roseospira navarrensis]|uniref:Ysc84 actin-binding domain-containing protein n=1 Tax=Roseospira navarrensis TaxID=140058 RepID=A0A7X1ZAR8_9PROT|nr:hypothetical protein [Roseospira navarrensis]
MGRVRQSRFSRPRRRDGRRAALLATVGLLMALPPAPVLAQSGETGQPVPLIGPSNGTLDPSLGELDQPPLPIEPTAGPRTGATTGSTGANPPLSPPRVIDGGPGTRPHLAAPDAPTAPSAPGLAAPAPSATAGTATLTRGSDDPARAEALARAMGTASDAAATVTELRADSGFQADMNDFLARARAVMVIPSFFRAGFVVGGAYGSAVLTVRDETGAFSEPAFYRMAAGSVGLQIGAQDARIILLVMTDAGLQAILKDQFKLEAGANVTFGLYGGGVSTGSTTDVNQDILAFSHSRGIFGGGALEGAVIEPRHDWNAAYYDTPGILPRTILFETPVANPVSRPLIQALQAPVGGGG